MARPIRQRCPLRVEQLESRLAPATLINATTLTFTDVDGDLATVSVSRGTLAPNDFTFVNAGLGQQLQEIDLSLGQCAGANLSITAKAHGGDGLVNVGYIDSAAFDLGTVTVQGDLGRIDAGDAVTTPQSPGLVKLAVHSLGRFGTTTQAAGGNLLSNIQGTLGTLAVATDMVGVTLTAFTTTNTNGSIGVVNIGGSLIGGGGDDGIYTSDAIGAVTIGGNIEGDAHAGSANIAARSTLASLMVGGSILGGAGQASAQVSSDNYGNGGGIGPVTVKGSIVGSAGELSAEIVSGASLNNVMVGGSVIGGSGTSSGEIKSIGNMGSVSIGHDLEGSTGDESAKINSNGAIKAITLGGSLLGGTGNYNTNGAAKGQVGAAGDGSGSIYAGSINVANLGGSLQGGAGFNAGLLFASVTLGNVTIGGSVVAGSGEDAGDVGSFNNVGNVTIGVDINGGSIFADRNIAGVTVRGSIIAGAFNGLNTGITASGVLGPIVVNGSLVGNSSSTVDIFAGGTTASASATTDVVIRSLTVTGRVQYAVIEAGNDAQGNAINGNARIGAVQVGNDWIASSLTAGVTPGADGIFGTADDAPIGGGNPKVLSMLTSVTIGGQVLGTPSDGVGNDNTDQFGFIAQQVGKFSVNGVSYAVHAGPDNDQIAIGVTNDVTLREV